MDDFLVRALIAGLGLAVVAGPLGSFVVWRRMAFFGDTLAHSALLGIALGFLLEVNAAIGILVVCTGVAIALASGAPRVRLAPDTLLGILSHSALSLGLLAVAFLDRVRFDLMALLFGDILAVSSGDLVVVLAGGGLVLGALALLWRPLLALSVHEELAQVEGVPVARTRLMFLLLLAAVIAIAMKIVGVLLITSLLIIPAAAARPFARTPEQMAAIAAGFAALSVALGLLASVTWDLPAAPAMVAAAAGLFLASQIRRRAA
ncbi:MAG: zinc ABC transporter permease subunit ZnuB [Thalassobaculales bacterium]